MEWFYFWILTTMLAMTLAVTLFKPEKIYEYPYFMAAAFAVFIVPQAVSLIRFPGAAQPEWVANVLLMCCLCFGACWVGYRRPPVQSWQQRLSHPVDLDRLFHGGLVFVAASFFFNALIFGMSAEERGGGDIGLWTGKVTIYAFFGGLIYPGFAICLMTALRTGGLMAWLATAVATIQPIEISLFSGRREATVLFLMTLALTLYYQRGIKPARPAIVLSVLLAMLAIPATGTYRALAAEHDWEAVAQMHLVDNFEEFVNQESNLELRNAAVLMEATRRSGDYQYGEGYWDHLVFRFVPAQLVGKEFKDGLMFHPSTELIENEFSKLGYEATVGATMTGMGDSFQQLGWFGCLFFALMGLMFKTLFSATVRPNAVFAQLLYIQIGTSAMRAVTHQTLDFLPGLLYYLIFLGLIYWYARVPASSTIPNASVSTLPNGRGWRKRKKRAVQSLQEAAPFSVTAATKVEIGKAENGTLKAQSGEQGGRGKAEN